jgi:hypothetical protein
MSGQAPQTYEEFEKQLKQFGNSIRNEFNNKLNDATLNGQQINNDQLREILVGVINNPKHSNGLELVRDGLIGYHIPRADDPRATQKAEVANTNRRQGPDVQLQLPSWAAGFDGISIPNNQNVNNTNKAGIFTQFDKVLSDAENAARQEYALRNKPRFAPQPSPSLKKDK